MASQLLIFLGISLGVFAYAQGLEHVVCNRRFNKIGCFHSKKLVHTLLINDRDTTSDKFQGHLVKWKEIEEYLHSLACRCEIEARKNRFEYFGIRFYGECYGGNVDFIELKHKSSKCFQGISYGECNDTNIMECGGTEFADYVYALKSSAGPDVDGGYGEWTLWSGCSEECGGGKRSRTRACDNPLPKGSGKDCSSLGNDTEIGNCGTMPCPVDGGFSEWSLFGNCSKECGGGIRARTRTCTNPAPAHGGSDCEGATSETESCNAEACPVDGSFSDWSSYGACSVTCGKGVHTRTRTCTNPPPSDGGKDCQGLYKESSVCDAGCCPVHGGYGDWEAAGVCSKSCGGGEQVFRRKCDRPVPANNGRNCSALGPAEEKRECNVQPCPVDGGFSQWTAFGSCSISCGIGFKYRTRLCNTPAPAHGGKDCEGDLREAMSCNGDHCKGNLALNKPTKQSSTGWSGPSSKAVDGNKNTFYHARSCTHTHRDSKPWWRVDLGGRHVVGNIKITNRGDCCSSRLRSVEVRVGDVDSVAGNTLCTYYPRAFGAGATQTLYCSVPITGRFVYISLRVREWLTLCEVEVYSPDQANLARGRPTKQSSTSHGGLPSRAVDGNRAVNWRYGSCTHTNRQKNPWWRVDLGSIQPVGEVVLTNRGDCCGNRLRNVEIRVGNVDSNPSANSLCIYHNGAIASGQSQKFYCTSIVTGRYVYVFLKTTEYLTICEVEVYKANIENLARGKPTKQSSIGWNGHPSRAVDGNTATNYHRGSCTHTHRQTGAWWRVDLQAPRSVGKVAVTNRGDCCSNRLRKVEVRVGNTDSPVANPICTYHESAIAAGVTNTLYCSRPMVGRYVFIRIRVNDYLTLCEVAVFSLKHGEKVNGGFSEWSSYGTCSKTCGGGVKYSTRTCSNPFPANGGRNCAGTTKKSAACNTNKCPVNGGFSAWSAWGRCSARCGSGRQWRTRRCNNPSPSHGGAPCRGTFVETRSCQAKPCPVHGGYGPWSRYGACSATCGHGYQTRSRNCNRPTPAHGGSSCARLGPAYEKRRCHLRRCPSPVSPQYHKRVCEHSNLRIACPVGSRIRISYALYGRQTRAHCRRGWWTNFYSTRCKARTSRAKVAARCNNRRTCSVPAKNWLFGDPCVFTYKYLEAKYHCFGSSAQSHHAKVCEFRQQRIECPFGRKIKVTYAMYGRLNRHDCPYHKHTTTTTCRAGSSFSRTKALCDGKRSCVLNASNGVYGDPCVTVHKYLKVYYRCIW